MSVCPGLVFASAPVGRTPKGGFGLISESTAISQIQSVIPSLGCAVTEANGTAFWDPLLVVAAGETIIDPGFSASSLMNPIFGQPSGNFSGFSIGLYINGVSRGSFDWGVTGGNTVTFADNTTVHFPYVADSNFGFISFSNIGGQGCDGVTWNPNQNTGTFVNYHTWFCCASAGFNCCEPAGNPGPHFLIPRPNSGSLLPGQLQSSTPALQKMIFLSNYTFQFTNDFGRIRPQ